MGYEANAPINQRATGARVTSLRDFLLLFFFIDLGARSETGVSILAVSRAGRVNYDPDPDMQIYPGDRLVIMGPPEELTQAEALLKQAQEQDESDVTDRLVVGEVDIAAGSPLAGMTLADTRFRQTHNVTVVGIRRGEEQITTPAPSQRIAAGDSLIVIGAARAVTELKSKEPL